MMSVRRYDDERERDVCVVKGEGIAWSMHHSDSDDDEKGD